MTKISGFIEKLHDDAAVIALMDRTKRTISRSQLPANCKQGDFIVQQDDSNFRIDHELTEKRQRELRRMTDCYFE
jgi:hypothetical protein